MCAARGCGTLFREVCQYAFRCFLEKDSFWNRCLAHQRSLVDAIQVLGECAHEETQAVRCALRNALGVERGLDLNVSQPHCVSELDRKSVV